MSQVVLKYLLRNTLLDRYANKNGFCQPRIEVKLVQKHRIEAVTAFITSTYLLKANVNSRQNLTIARMKTTKIPSRRLISRILFNIS